MSVHVCVYVCLFSKSVCKLLSTSQGVGSHWISSELAKHQIAEITVFVCVGVRMCVCVVERRGAADISRNRGKH